MIQYLQAALVNKVKIIVLTRSVEDFQGKNVTSLRENLDILQSAGIKLVYRSNIHQKFAIID